LSGPLFLAIDPVKTAETLACSHGVDEVYGGRYPHRQAPAGVLGGVKVSPSKSVGLGREFFGVAQQKAKG